ncbi:hypothetical protein NZZ21_002077 [Escherichia albertii]|nr:hypothetical protein [Escherichia albertii]EJQ6146454.1 hypothetical protein [Escherichia albertii]
MDKKRARQIFILLQGTFLKLFWLLSSQGGSIGIMRNSRKNLSPKPERN